MTDEGEFEGGHHKRWTDQDDRFLLAYGWCVGIRQVAEHDLGRTEAAARRRLTWLRKNKPDLVAEKWGGGATRRKLNAGPQTQKEPAPPEGRAGLWSGNMKLWLISQNENKQYDTYDSAVVCAHTEEDARSIHPDGRMLHPSLWRQPCGDWASSPDKVDAKEIGLARSGTLRGVVLSSFRAG